MAKLYVTEYGDHYGTSQVVAEPAIVDQTPVDFTSGVASSATFSQDTHIVRIHTDSICSIKFGTNPTATTNNRRMNAGDTEYVAVRPGDKVSVISNT